MEHNSQCIKLFKNEISKEKIKTKRVSTSKEYKESVKRANERIKASHDVYSNARLQAKNVYTLKRTK